jgi:hypothetical protein
VATSPPIVAPLRAPRSSGISLGDLLRAARPHDRATLAAEASGEVTFVAGAQVGIGQDVGVPDCVCQRFDQRVVDHDGVYAGCRRSRS